MCARSPSRQQHTRVFVVGLCGWCREKGNSSTHSLGRRHMKCHGRSLGFSGMRDIQRMWTDGWNIEMREKKSGKLTQQHNDIMWIICVYYLLKLNIPNSPILSIHATGMIHTCMYPKAHTRLFIPALFVTAPRCKPLQV